MDEAGAEDLNAVADGGEADEMPEEASKTAADEPVDDESAQVEGDADDPETRATRREGLN